MYCVGIAPPTTSLANSNPAPRGSGSTRKIHLAELACAAGLLLVAVVAVGAVAHRLSVRDLRRPGHELEPELALHSLEHEPYVQLAEASQHGLVLLRVELDLQARILDSELVQRVG